MSTLLEIFRQCCTPRERPCRFDLYQPFTQRTFVYATCGYIAVRVCITRWPETPLPIATGRTPPMLELPWHDGGNWPERSLPDPGPVVMETCEECNGLDSVECEACGGDRTWPRNDRLIVDAEKNVGLGRERIRDLVSWGVKSVRVNPEGSPVCPVYFEVGDVQWLLMPMAGNNEVAGSYIDEDRA